MATHDVASQVSLVVVVHGRRDLLARLLESIDAHTPQPHEVIVVDNCSPDDTVDWLRRHRPDVVVLEPGVNLGYGAGANLGVQAASGALVAVMNSDLEVTEGWLQPLVEALDDPDTAIAAPVTVAADDEIVEAGAVVDRDGHVHVRDETIVTDRSVAHASASCWVMRRDWFRRVGGFDPGFGLGYYEDLDLTAWADLLGVRVVVVARSRVRHEVGGSFGSELARRLSHRNHRRATERWRALRLESAGRRHGELHRVHGHVALLELDDATAESLRSHLLGLNVDVGRLTAQDLTAPGSWRWDVVVAPTERPDGVDAPRAVWTTPAGIEDAMLQAGIATSRAPRRPMAPFRAAVTSGQHPVEGVDHG